MFRSLGLFASARCPDPSCHRPKCLFNHGEPSTAQKPSSAHSKAASKARGSVAASAGPGNSARTTPTSSSVPKAKQEERAASGDGPSTKKARIEKDEGVGKGTPAALVASSSLKTSTSPSKPRPEPLLVRKPSVPEAIINPLRPPSIPTNNLKISPQPWADRQKGLQTLFQQFTKLYRPILPSSPELAHTSALRQESEVSSTCPNIKSYKSAIHHAAVSVSRRPIPDSSTHPSVGTVKESRAAYEKLEKDLAGRLTKEKTAPYLLPLDKFDLWSYPDPRNEALLQGGDEPDCEGTEQTCSRCKKGFVVSSQDLDKRIGECVFHYGRIQPERIEGKRKWIYSCCRRERGEVGCEEGVHVFTDGDDDVMLAKRKAFKTVKQVWQEKSSAKERDSSSAKQSNGENSVAGAHQASKVCEVVAMDCEMIYTTGGSSLARVTIVDQAGEMLLDERVRQPVPILDINTRFSGLHSGDLDDAVMDVDAVRSAACVFIGPDTVMVGHGLENDLRALRLLHDKIIDTAIVFPHDKGPPYRRALRDLVKEKLGYFIQERTADLGHSSAEDAKATLEVLKWKVRDDAS